MVEKTSYFLYCLHLTCCSTLTFYPYHIRTVPCWVCHLTDEPVMLNSFFTRHHGSSYIVSKLSYIHYLFSLSRNAVNLPQKRRFESFIKTMIVCYFRQYVQFRCSCCASVCCHLKTSFTSDLPSVNNGASGSHARVHLNKGLLEVKDSPVLTNFRWKHHLLYYIIIKLF